MLVKRYLIPHPNFQNMKRSFPPFAVIYSSNSGNTFSTMMPQWTSDNDVPLSEFSTERALGKVATRSNHTMLVLKTTIRLPLSTKELQKLGLQTPYKKAIL
jgi:hypothetical protein